MIEGALGLAMLVFLLVIDYSNDSKWF